MFCFRLFHCMDFRRGCKMKSKNDTLSDQPWPFTRVAFKRFAVKVYPRASNQEHDLIADAIYRWFFGEWG